MIIAILITYTLVGVAIFVMAAGYDQITKKNNRELLSLALGSLLWFPILMREIWRGHQRGR